MNSHLNRYTAGYILMVIIAGVSGWLIQGALDGYVYWSLPIFITASLLFMLSGDTVVESLVILLILGLFTLIALTNEAVVAKLGAGKIWGFFSAIGVAKFGYVIVKEVNSRKRQKS